VLFILLIIVGASCFC
ncbi:YjcZ family sporulation protein, partial [Bacillus mycoides]